MVQTTGRSWTSEANHGTQTRQDGCTGARRCPTCGEPSLAAITNHICDDCADAYRYCADCSEVDNDEPWDLEDTDWDAIGRESEEEMERTNPEWFAANKDKLDNHLAAAMGVMGEPDWLIEEVLAKARARRARAAEGAQYDGKPIDPPITSGTQPRGPVRLAHKTVDEILDEILPHADALARRLGEAEASHSNSLDAAPSRPATEAGQTTQYAPCPDCGKRSLAAIMDHRCEDCPDHYRYCPDCSKARAASEDG